MEPEVEPEVAHQQGMIRPPPCMFDRHPHACPAPACLFHLRPHACSTSAQMHVPPPPFDLRPHVHVRPPPARACSTSARTCMFHLRLHVHVPPPLAFMFNLSPHACFRACVQNMAVLDTSRPFAPLLFDSAQLLMIATWAPAGSSFDLSPPDLFNLSLEELVLRTWMFSTLRGGVITQGGATG